MNLESWLMQEFGAEKFAPGLERVRLFVEDYLAQIKSQAPKIITVSGTNGKGQTALSIARHLQFNHKTYALWTSPHIERVTERFVTHEGEIKIDILQNLLLFEAARAKRLNVGLSYYEILWAAFLRWLTLNPQEYYVLEVGLGGRLDAVNLLDADLVALTSISRDHQEYLGSRYESILFEKLGVLRANSTLYSNLSLDYLNQQVQRHSKNLGYSWVNLHSPSKAGPCDDFWQSNETLSRRIIEAMGLVAAPETLVYQGRGESVQFRGHEFIFYGSHNPDGARKLIQLLQRRTYNFKESNFDQVWVAMSHRSEKDLVVMTKIFSQFMQWDIPVCFALFNHPKAAAKSGWWQSTKAEYFEDWQLMLEQLNSEKNQKVLVTGSYYFISQLKSFFSQSS